MRVLIVEDEPLVRQRLLRMCAELVGSRARFDAVPELDTAIDLLRKSVYDGLLLDLSLGGEDGFDLLRREVVGRYPCVVISAHSGRALEAFDHGVLDFVPKPFSRERLDLALNRLLDSVRFRPGSVRYLGIWQARGTSLVELKNVAWVRADGEYSELRLIDGRSELHDKPLTALATLLPPDFVRCHRSHLVNIRHVRALHAGSGTRYWLTLSNGDQLPVGRTHIASLRRALSLDQ